MKNKIRTLVEKLRTSDKSVMFQALVTFKPLADLGTQSGQLSGIYTGGDLSSYVSKLFVFAISLGAIFSVVRLMYAGYLYMGQDMWGSKQKAKDIFQQVIIGLGLLLTIWLILLKINPQLLNIQVLDSVKSSQATGLNQPANAQKQGSATCKSACPVYCDPGTGECI